MMSSDGYDAIADTDDTHSVNVLNRFESQRLLPSLMESKTDQITPQFYQEICDKLENCAKDNAGLDVYQMTAFYKYYHPDDSDAKFKYTLYVCKSIICCLIQTFGMIAFLYNVLNTTPISVLECQFDQPWDMKVLATLLSLYIALQMVSLIKVRKNDGLYENIAYAPPFVGTEWLYVGLYSNFFALITSIYGSFLIIYSSTTALSMVLNSVALYFIMDLDVFMIDHFDYVRVKQFMTKEFTFDEWYTDDWYNMNEGNVRFVYLLGVPMQIGGRKGDWGACGACCAYTGGICMVLATSIGLLGAIVLPIAIGICY